MAGRLGERRGGPLRRWLAAMMMPLVVIAATPAPAALPLAAAAPTAAPMPIEPPGRTTPDRPPAATEAPEATEATAQAPAAAPRPTRNRVRWHRAPAQTATAAATAEKEVDLTPTANASLTAPRPPRRPRVVAAPATPAAPAVVTTANARLRPVLPRVTPATPQVVRQALERSALIGVMNLTTGRNALMRLPDGAVRRVSVGDTIGGWRVASIASNAIRLTRGGKNHTLTLVGR